MTESIIRKNSSNSVKSFIDNTKLYFSDENLVSVNETSIYSTEMSTNKKIKVSLKLEEIKTFCRIRPIKGQINYLQYLKMMTEYLI